MASIGWIGSSAIRRIVPSLAGLSLAVISASASVAGEAAVAEVQSAAYAADFAGGIAKLKGMAAADRGDVEAVLGLGVLEVLHALSAMQEGLWRHSIETGPTTAGRLGMVPGGLPFMTGLGFTSPMLVPVNPAATPMTYAALRGVIERLVRDLATAEATLAKVGDRAVKLPLEPFRIAMDLDHDGKIGPTETLLGALSERVRAGQATIVFDTADASWLPGYVNLMMASANLFLAVDFERTYEAVGHTLYGRAATVFGRGLAQLAAVPRPAATIQVELDRVEAKIAALGKAPVDPEARRELQVRLQALPRTPEGDEERRRVLAELRHLDQLIASYHAESRDLMNQRRQLTEERSGVMPGSAYGGILDLVAGVHTMSWKVIAPDRLKAVRSHLLQVIAINRETWRLARAETDDDREWLPNARQTAPLGAANLTDEVIDSWLMTMALLEDVLEGRKLLPHPRFRHGVNLKRLLETATEIDVVLMITGHGLIPYLEEGEIVSGQTWRALTQPMGPDFWRNAIWFN